jgi:3-oxoacyl-[acyl-carrier-protein] synthase-3
VLRKVFIAGSGAYLPGDPIPFSQAQNVLGALSEAPPKIRRWMEKTSEVMDELLDIKVMHYAIDPETREFTDDNVTMSVKAAKTAIEHAGCDAQSIDLICCGSPHQDQMPTASVLIQEALCIDCCAELSIHANCTSAYKAIHLAHQLLEKGAYQTALVTSSNVASSELRAEYYNQALVDRESLFLRWFLCDGAGALVLTTDPALSKGFEVEHTYIESIGRGRPPHMFNLRPSYWLNPKEEYERGLHHLRQMFRNSLGTEVFQEPDGSIFCNGFKRMLKGTGIGLDTIGLFQINLPARHIADSVRDELEAMGLPPSVIYSKLDELGYAGPPTAIICLDKIVREETLPPGQRVVSFVTEVSKFMQAGYVLRRHDR